MGSKWISKDLFSKHLEEREKEKENRAPRMNRSDKVWPSLKAGTQDDAMVYEGRFLPDPNGILSKRYYYHMWRSGDKWYSMLCPKTHNFGNWCPTCGVVSTLYNGTVEDKKLAREMKRKERFAANFHITVDPRDAQARDEESKMIGKTRIYEFPSKIDEKLKAEEDEKEGLQEAVWDPGEDGHNFILKVKTTKPDANKNTYPDYSNSTFSRKTGPLGSDKEIKDIMESTHDITAHIKSMERDDKWVQDTLVSEGLFQLVERDWKKHHNTPEPTGPSESDDVGNFTDPAKDTAAPENDEDLLKQLDNLKY